MHDEPSSEHGPLSAGTRPLAQNAEARRSCRDLNANEVTGPSHLVQANAADPIDLGVDAPVMVTKEANPRTYPPYCLGKACGFADVALFA